MTMQTDYPVKTICDVLDLPRSAFYHQARRQHDEALSVALLNMAGQYPTYGYRRLTALLKQAGSPVNHKRVQRIKTEMELRHP